MRREDRFRRAGILASALKSAWREYPSGVVTRMTLSPHAITLVVFTIGLAGLPIGALAEDAIPKDDVVLRALVDELSRSVDQLQLEGLPKPYFLHLSAEDRVMHTINAEYGGVVHDDTGHSRYVTARSRVGSFALDNTNVPRGAGDTGLLPIDDDYVALRHAIWLVVDQDYKDAVETLARKLAYLKDKKTEDRPDDYSPAEKVDGIQPIKPFPFDRAAWVQHAAELSARFQKYPKIQDATVSFVAGVSTSWIVNSEGTRVRTTDTGVMLEFRAKLQASDGMDLDDVRTYVGLTTEDLPAMEKLSVDLDEMCGKLIALSEAPILEEYTGPVLFDPVATGSVLATLLADGLCARPVPLGGGRIVDASLEKKLGLRILPRSFNVYDDPTHQRFDGKVLAGAYDFDDEGVSPRRVDLVEKGIVNKLLAGRAPTKRIHGTTGHARGRGFAEPKANIGCLYVVDEQAMPDAELKQEFVQAVKEEGLPHGLRVEALDQGQRGSLGPPRYAYKVDAETGKETLVRGAEFKPVQTRSLKRVLAAGDKREVYNSLTPVGTSIVAPAVLFEELELARVEREFDRLPALPPPAMRQP